MPPPFGTHPDQGSQPNLNSFVEVAVAPALVYTKGVRGAVTRLEALTPAGMAGPRMFHELGALPAEQSLLVPGSR